MRDAYPYHGRTRAYHAAANNDKGDWIDGEKTEHVVAYLDRLYTAKRAVDERISVLSGGAGESVCLHLFGLISSLTTTHTDQ